MYISNFFSIGERHAGSVFMTKKKDGQIIEALYDSIVGYANKENLKIVKVSNVEEGTIGRSGTAVIFEK